MNANRLRILFQALKHGEEDRSTRFTGDVTELSDRDFAERMREEIHAKAETKDHRD